MKPKIYRLIDSSEKSLSKLDDHQSMLAANYLYGVLKGLTIINPKMPDENTWRLIDNHLKSLL